MTAGDQPSALLPERFRVVEAERHRNPVHRGNRQARVGVIAVRGRSVVMIKYVPPPITTPKNHP
jgi:hypothetical protein